jgi:hypothetical protein
MNEIKRPDVSDLLKIIIAEAEICLQKANFIENFEKLEFAVFIIRQRINEFRLAREKDWFDLLIAGA